MPRGDLPGWHQVLADDFGGHRIYSAHWSLYTGPDHANPNTHWRKQNAVVGGGSVDLAAYYDAASHEWTSAGMTSSNAVVQTYGMYLIRARSDRAAGIPFVALLWPTTGWPPEIDFMEDPTGNRASLTSTLHYGSTNAMIHRATAVDMSAWHTYGVIWTPGLLKYTLDGKVWAQVRSSAVPSRPMVLDIQSEIGDCSAPGACRVAGQSVARSQIDWAVIYSYRP